MLQNPQATEDSVTSAAGTGRDPRALGGMWNTGQRPAVQSSTTYIYIYYTGQKNAGQGEVSKTSSKLTGSFNSKCYTQSTRFKEEKGRNKKKNETSGDLKIKNTSRTQKPHDLWK